MAGANYSVSINDDEIHKRLNKVLQQGTNLKPAFEDIGEMLLITHDQRFRGQKSPDGTPWAPLSDEYRKRKPKHKDTILTLNSILSGNLSYIATGSNLFFGTPSEYGAIHQFGGSPEMRPQNAAIPKREWLGLEEDDKPEIFDILADFLMEE